MQIKDSKLFIDDQPVRFQKSPNAKGGLEPRYLVIHCTEGVSLESSVSWLGDPDTDSKSSAHFVIGKDSTIVQLVDLSVIAFHLGEAEWQGQRILNRDCIGIELDNPGSLTLEQGQGKKGSDNLEKTKVWKKADTEYSTEDVIEAIHPREIKSRHWLKYPLGQVCTTLALAKLLVVEYDLVEVFGHDEIAHKTDPGPAFDMESFRHELFGRKQPLAEI